MLHRLSDKRVLVGLLALISTALVYVLAVGLVLTAARPTVRAMSCTTSLPASFSWHGVRSGDPFAKDPRGAVDACTVAGGAVHPTASYDGTSLRISGMAGNNHDPARTPASAKLDGLVPVAHVVRLDRAKYPALIELADAITPGIDLDRTGMMRLEEHRLKATSVEQHGTQVTFTTPPMPLDERTLVRVSWLTPAKATEFLAKQAPSAMR